jgi:hypothetical protein
VPATEVYEHSEMILYRAMILEEGGQFKQALSYLEASKVNCMRGDPVSRLCFRS